MSTKTKVDVSADVKALLTIGTQFAEHLTNGNFDAAQADMDARDAIIKNDRKAWDLAKKQHAADVAKAA